MKEWMRRNQVQEERGRKEIFFGDDKEKEDTDIMSDGKRRDERGRRKHATRAHD